MGILKEVGDIFSLCVYDDKFISAFLDSSGIRKKPNYKKEIAENTAQIAKLLKERNQNL